MHYTLRVKSCIDHGLPEVYILRADYYTFHRFVKEDEQLSIQVCIYLLKQVDKVQRITAKSIGRLIAVFD